MASKSTYECFVCKNNGFAGVQVCLAGKDDQGRAIRLESDAVTPHVHKTKVPSQQTQQPQGSMTTVVTEPTATKILNAKLDRIISLLEERLPHSKTE